MTGDHRNLTVLTHSFPKRRSSDLARITGSGTTGGSTGATRSSSSSSAGSGATSARATATAPSTGRNSTASKMNGPTRSEEHTSELQSLMRSSYAVFCLKKKQNTNRTNLQRNTTHNKKHAHQ